MADAPNWRDDDAFRGRGGGGGGAGRGAAQESAPESAPAAATPTTVLPSDARTTQPAAAPEPAAGEVDDAMPLRVEIPRCAPQEDPDNESKQHTVYTIFCSKGKHGWMVQRRYTQFCQLHAQLSAVGLAGLPELPPKKLVGNMAAEFVEQRRVGLESYLQQVCTMAGEAGADGSTKAVLKPLYTFVGADWLLDEGEAGDALDGWVRQLTSPHGALPSKGATK
eukprot:COSAG02_NODE_2866_length_7865_cov_7.555498_7_plen_222_part_00